MIASEAVEVLHGICDDREALTRGCGFIDKGFVPVEQIRSILDAVKPEGWDDLLRILATTYPDSIFPRKSIDADYGNGPQVISLLRIINDLREQAATQARPPSGSLPTPLPAANALGEDRVTRKRTVADVTALLDLISDQAARGFDDLLHDEVRWNLSDVRSGYMLTAADRERVIEWFDSMAASSGSEQADVDLVRKLDGRD